MMSFPDPQHRDRRQGLKEPEGESGHHEATVGPVHHLQQRRDGPQRLKTLTPRRWGFRAANRGPTAVAALGHVRITHAAKLTRIAETGLENLRPAHVP
jgi:hypothetical protein